MDEIVRWGRPSATAASALAAGAGLAFIVQSEMTMARAAQVAKLVDEPSGEVDRARAVLVSALASEAHLWLARTDAMAGRTIARAEQLLDTDERQRLATFISDSERHRFLIGRALMRATLARYLPAGPSELRFERGRFGRPKLRLESGDPPLNFSQSQADGLCASLVTSGTACGVDVERIIDVSDLSRVTGLAFAASEQQIMAELPADQRRERFFSFWTLKEAYTKARGTGLSFQLDRAAFDIDGTTGRLRDEPDLNDSPGDWQFHLQRLEPDLSLSVALRRGAAADFRVVTRWMQLGVAGTLAADLRAGR
jgi:4'-phosphopantetheinyl transferase